MVGRLFSFFGKVKFEELYKSIWANHFGPSVRSTNRGSSFSLTANSFGAFILEDLSLDVLGWVLSQQKSFKMDGFQVRNVLLQGAPILSFKPFDFRGVIPYENNWVIFFLLKL